MSRLVLISAFLWLAAANPVAQDPPLVIDVPNTGPHATALRVIELPHAAISGTWALSGPDGKHVPAAWNANDKVLRFLAEVPAGGGKYTLMKGTKSTAQMPAWKKAKLASDKKVIERAGGSIDNGLLRLEVMADKELHGRVEISALKGGYRLRYSPLGSSVGCVETMEDARKVAQDYEKGVQHSPELFYITPGIATKIEVAESNPFQRVVSVTCFDFARRNDGKVLKLFESTGYEITLTWHSPVVRIRSARKLQTTYLNHNGVNLNEIYVDELPIGFAGDGGEMADVQIAAKGRALPLKFERAMLLRDKTGQTAIMQPDFRKLAIYKECLVLAEDRIMTIQSQSWHEGWKAIEIKAGEYIDIVTLACNVGATGKSVKDWELELLGAPSEEKK